LFAETAVQEFVKRLVPGNTWLNKESIKERGGLVVYATGNPEHTTKRWENLKSQAVAGPSPAELQAAITACGLDLEAGQPLPRNRHYMQPKEKAAYFESKKKGYGFDVEGEASPDDMVTINPVANAGFPVLVTLNTEGAMERVVSLAVEIEWEVTKFLRSVGAQDVDEANGKWTVPLFQEGRYMLELRQRGGDKFWVLLDLYLEWYELAANQRPYMYAVQGKCKTDYYKLSKLEGREMRFYNVVPAQLGLIAKQATQAFEANAKNIMDDPLMYTSGQGLSYAHGGADAFVDALDLALASAGEYGIVHNHTGDDSLCFCLSTNRGWMLGLTVDLTHFDLTQDSKMTSDLDKEVARRLYAVNAPAALVWYGLRRKRLTVMAHTVPVWVENGGPSGLLLQSKVNDVLSEILWERLTLSIYRSGVLKREAPPEREELNAIFIKECTKMGFRGRLESFDVVRCQTVRDFVRAKPTLYLGYYLHYRQELDRVVVFADPARTCAQIRYPTTRFVKGIANFQLAERIRVASTILGMGIPPEGQEVAFGALVTYAREGLKDVPDGLNLPSMTWLLSQVEGGPEKEKDVAGLKSALGRIHQIWLEGGVAAAIGEEPIVVGRLRKALDLPKLSTPLDVARVSNMGRAGSSYAAKRQAVVDRMAKMALWRSGEQSSARERRRDPLQYRKEEFFVPVDYGDDWDDEY